jgi:hypothetical protein
MKKLLLILLCLPMVGFGQGWEKNFGSSGNYEDVGTSVQQTTDGGYIITGKFENEAYLLKTDANGIKEWSNTWGYYSAGFSVQQTNDGGYIITGQKGIGQEVWENCEIYLIKTDNIGNEVWSKTIDHDSLAGTNLWISGGVGYSVQQTNDGGYIVVGCIYTGGNIDSYAFMLKTDVNGTKEWSYPFGGGSGIDQFFSVQQTSDLGYISTGWREHAGGFDLYLVKHSGGPNSNSFSKLFGGLGQERGNSVQQTNDGGYIVVGETDSYSNNALRDIWLIKTDAYGDSLWTKTFGGWGDEYGTSIQQTNDGGYIITGTISNPFMDVYLLKTDAFGDSLWFKTFGGLGYDLGNSVQQTNDGGYIITGKTSSVGNGAFDVYLIKTDGSGNITSTFNIPISPYRKLQKIVDILGKQTKPQTNQPLFYIYDDGTVEKRIVIE